MGMFPEPVDAIAVDGQTNAVDGQGRTVAPEIASDITERKRAERALLDSEQRYRLLFNANPHPMWFFDASTLAFLDVNDSAIESYGYSREEFLSMTIKDIRPPETVSHLLADIAQDHKGLDVAGQWRHKKKDGTIIHVDITSHEIDYAGRKAKVVLAHDITARVRADEVLQESERRLREMLENLELIAITLDIHGTVTFCNDYLLALTGWKREEVMNADWFSTFIPDATPDTKKIFLDTVVTGNIPSHDENPIRTKSGELREILWNNTMLRDIAGNIVGTAGIGEDITDRKRGEQDLRESNERFLQLSDAIKEVFWLTDPQKNETLYISRGYEEIWGRTCKSLLANPILRTESIHPDDRDRVLQSGVSKQVAGTYDEEYRIVRPDGTIRWIHEKAFPVKDQSGAVSRVAGVAEDITERKSLEQQLRQAQKLESLGTLAGGIAHDFNNILGIILGHASLMSRHEMDPGKLARSTEAITKASHRGASLVRQLLTFARKTEPMLESVSVNDIILELVKLLQETFPETITVTHSLAGGLPGIIADSNQLHQTILNLCVNSRDAMPDGGTLTISTAIALSDTVRREFSDATAKRYVCISIIDTGTGVDEATILRMFEPFFTTKELGKGTGLGLAVVYGIVKSLSGHIGVESAVGKGTTFRLYFPVLEHDRIPFEAATAEPADDLGGSETVLVVEDEEMLMDLLTTLLEAKGYRVVSARDGEELVDVYKRHVGSIALVITDLGLPKRDGYSAFLELKRINAQVKVIISTGYVSSAQRTMMLLGGVKDIITKPFAPLQLLQRVRRVIDS